MDLLLALACAVLGAAAGALVSGKTISYAYYRQAIKLAADRDARTLLNLFTALAAELSLTWQAYLSVVGQDLERAEGADDLHFAGLFAASRGYFSVYENSAQLLGALDPASSRQLIETYVNVQAFFNEVNSFQRLQDNYRDVRLKANINLYEAKEVREEVERAFSYLQKRHLQVKGLVLAALETLKEFQALGRQSATQVKISI